MSLSSAINGAIRNIAQLLIGQSGSNRDLSGVYAGEGGFFRLVFGRYRWRKYTYTITYTYSGATYSRTFNKSDHILCSSEPGGETVSIAVSAYTPSRDGYHHQYPYFLDEDWVEYSKVYISDDEYRITGKIMEEYILKGSEVGIVVSDNAQTYPDDGILDGYYYEVLINDSI